MTDIESNHGKVSATKFIEFFEFLGDWDTAVAARAGVRPPQARATDPASSHGAARSVREIAARQARLTLELVEDYPASTSRELSHRSTELDRYQIARRLSDLERAGKVRTGPIRNCAYGRPSPTWYLREYT